MMNKDMKLYMIASEFDDYFLPVRNTVYKTLKGAEKGRLDYLKDGSKIPVVIIETYQWAKSEKGI